MARHTTAYRRRGGFTLVEMLVSTALIIFVLLIITTVFTTGIGALRALRGAGHLQDEARHAVAALRRDLAAPHFGRETDGLRGPNLSQQRLDLYDWTPPKEGFFRITQMSEVNPTTGTRSNSMGVVEGIDGDLLTSTVATQHSLHFTVRIEPNAAQGTGREQFYFTGSILPLLKSSNLFLPNTLPKPGNDPLALYRLRMSQSSGHIIDPNWDVPPQTPLMYSPWAEVAYFLRESGQQAGASKLYTLYRRRRVLLDVQNAYLKPVGNNLPVVATDKDLATPGNITLAGQITDASIYIPPPAIATNQIFFNTPANITVPFRRLGSDQSPASPAGIFPNPDTLATPLPSPGGHHSINDDFSAANQGGGDDILLENVLSFEVKVNWDIPKDERIRRTANGLRLPYDFATNPDYPFDNLPESNPNSIPVNTAYTLQHRFFDTWRGENYTLQPTTGPAITVPYEQWDNPSASTAVTIPLRIRVKAIQIRIRVWDSKTQQTRQVTVVQDL